MSDMMTTTVPPTSTGNNIKWIFWSIATIDSIALVIVLIMLLTHKQSGSDNGAAAMGWFYLFQMPVILLGLSMALVYFTRHVVWHSLALFIVASPVLLLFAL